MSIESIAEILNAGITDGAARNYEIEMCLRPGADDTSIDACEEALGVPIPAERYADWYSEDGDQSAGRYWQQFLVLASYGAGICLLDVSGSSDRPYTVIDLDVDVEAGTGTLPIAADLEEWFRRMIASAVSRGTLVYWLHPDDELYPKPAVSGP